MDHPRQAFRLALAKLTLEAIAEMGEAAVDEVADVLGDLRALGGVGAVDAIHAGEALSEEQTLVLRVLLEGVSVHATLADLLTDDPLVGGPEPLAR